MNQRRGRRAIWCLLLSLPWLAPARGAVASAKFGGLNVLDRDHLTASFLEGEVTFKDDGKGASAFNSTNSQSEDNTVVTYGPLDLKAATAPANWKLTSIDDPAYGKAGKSPSGISRKAKLNGMAQQPWNDKAHDFTYGTPLTHTLFLSLPSPLKEGKHYRLMIDGKVDPASPNPEFVFDSFTTRSEALHVNLVGYPSDAPAITADLYAWLGDGGARDYASFAGAKVFLVAAATGDRREAGTVKFWKKRGGDLFGVDFTASDVWTVDASLPDAPGRYRIAIEGVGCSQDFTVGGKTYADPFKVAVRGFYYMRIGEAERPDIRPIPRQPRYIPGVSPADTKVLITTMQPYHSAWRTMTSEWDEPTEGWAKYLKPGSPVNPNAWGGHSDALDWDRHLGHVSIIYDMVYPYILTGGALADDDTGIAESGNGIPDVLDEARNEVDFWLRLRDGDGYSHGLTNPNKDHILYQAGTTTVAAWANAANAAMLADAFRIAGKDALAKEYLGYAVTAYAYAGRQPDTQLTNSWGEGNTTMRGADFKITAAAYLFDLTGEARYEDDVNALSVATTDTADINAKDGDQIWATAGYLLSTRPSRYPALLAHMKQSVLASAEAKEVAFSASRPSRRSCDDLNGYFPTTQDVHRTLLAHRICDDPALKKRFLAALLLEADWGLGRNPLNMIQMTTATTPLANLRSVENMFTSGRNDGTPGLHPGHTPYLNMDNSSGDHGMFMASPRKLAALGYPAYEAWPRGECYFNTRYVYAHSEFTPQQTMRGKFALYGYLYRKPADRL